MVVMLVQDSGQEETRQTWDKTVVLIEDDAHLVSLFSDALSLLSQWKLQVFSDGEAAKQSVPEMNAQLIILDVGLPSLDGASLYRILRAHNNTKQTPILVITGSQEWELHRMGLKPGYLLQKPFGIHELIAMIQALVP